MCDECLCQLLRRFLDVMRVRIQNGSQVESQLGFEQLATPVHVLAEHRFGLVNLARQVDALCALGGEHEHHRRFGSVRLSGDDSLRVTRGQCLHRVRDAVTNDHSPVAKGLSTDLQSKGDVGQVDFGVLLEVFAQIRGGGVESGFGFR